MKLGPVPNDSPIYVPSVAQKKTVLVPTLFVRSMFKSFAATSSPHNHAWYRPYEIVPAWDVGLVFFGSHRHLSTTNLYA